MDKRFAYIGIALMIIAFIILVANSFTTNIGSSFANVVVYSNMTIQPHSYGSASINASEASYFFVVAHTNKPVNFYFFNKSAYYAWRNATEAFPQGNGRFTAISLENKGAFMIYSNETNMSIPNATNPSSKPIYAANQSTPYGNGTYFLVVDNTNGSESSSYQINATVAYLPPINNSTISSGALSGLSGQLTEAIQVGVVFFIMLVAGIVLLAYGLIKKPQGQGAGTPQPGQKLNVRANQQDVDQMYQNVEKKRTKKKES